MGFYIGKQRITPVINKGRKYGTDIDLLLGGVDSAGKYVVPTTGFVLDMAGVKSIPISGLFGKFMRAINITKADMSSVESIGDYGCYMMFRSCRNMTSADLSGVKTLTTESMYQMFYDCVALVDVDLSLLTSCGNNSLAAAFYKCPALKKISFPSLTTVTSTSFGSGSYAFSGCTAMEEIHFRADMQATVEAMQGYSTKFGATDATIFFDL